MWDLFISVHLSPESHSHTLYLSRSHDFAGIFCPVTQYDCLGDHLVSAQKFIYHCPLSRLSLNLFDFYPGCHNELLFLSRGSQQFIISVQGVTMSYSFCPGGYNDLLFPSRCHSGFLFLSGGSLWTVMHVQGNLVFCHLF